MSGKRIVLAPGQVLCHWSDRSFTKQKSTEIAKIEKVFGSESVCASFFLYESDAAIPTMRPKALQFFGLAGKHRYTVTSSLRSAAIYLKNANATATNGAEVIVVLGCGGHISYDHKKTAASFLAGTM